METEKILTLVFERSAAINNWWIVYIAVLAGIGTLLAAEKPLLRTLPVKIGLIAIFVLFAVFNGLALANAFEQQRILLSMIHDNNSSVLALIASASPSSTLGVLIFHGVFDAAVISAIWFLPKWREVPQVLGPAKS